MRRLFRISAFAVVLCLLLAGITTVVWAQSDERFDPLFVRTVGDFEVAVRWLPPAPQVGFVNIALKPTIADTGEPVTDARVLVVAERSLVVNGENVIEPDFEVVAVNNPEEPTIYRANMKFEEAGNWVLHIQIDSPTSGQADFRAPIVTLPPPIEPGLEGGWVFLGIFIVLLAGSAYLVFSSRRARAAREAGL
ncbi:MAG: hypothetical protein OXC95_14135 [Dehalococcoidia bacterium]|nr:hypothetical protein [Dehalococcoidia bacterium]